MVKHSTHISATKYVAAFSQWAALGVQIWNWHQEGSSCLQSGRRRPQRLSFHGRCFIHIHANKLEATWLDRTEGFCQWKSECEPHDDASLLIGGLTNLYCHLCMLSRPFVLQIVVPYQNTWRIVTSNMDKLRHMLLNSDYASWYQLFPLSETDCQHRSMRQCLTNFSSSSSFWFITLACSTVTRHDQYFAAQGCKPIGRANPSRSPDKKNGRCFLLLLGRTPSRFDPLGAKGTHAAKSGRPQLFQAQVGQF